ncbi:MAG: ascorbate-dependent monooxygenase [Isosphaeraceae bacterium]|nr:ascorbate-dependent monooxygenase [Isosphaeraceae bacterium]
MRVTAEGRMPPWHASVEGSVRFRDARVLPAGAAAVLSSWVEGGVLEGDPGDAPAPRNFGSEWGLGAPDLVLRSGEMYQVPAEGPDETRVFVIPTGLTEGRWVQGIDFRPTAPKVVHHVLAAFDTSGRARQLDARDPMPGYRTAGGYGFWPAGEMDGWAPGKAPHRLPDGVARYLPAGSDLLVQVHYHKSGKVEADATAVGLYFARAPVDKQLHATGVFPPVKNLLPLRWNLRIPAGAADHEVTGEDVIRQDIHIVAVIPHMHWLGKDFLLNAERPDGSATTLVKIDRWDFNWQETYDLAEPLALSKGTTLRMRAHFDNSPANAVNPSRPPVEVRWGEQTTDEMCIAFLHFTRDDEHLAGRPPARFRQPKEDSGR